MKMIRRFRVGGNPLLRAALTILRKYGTDAHVYLPGIGVINGLTAGNYLDSAGTTGATVDNPVGLVLDANNTIGAEKIVNGTFDANTTGWSGNNANATLTWQSGGTALFQNVADFSFVRTLPALTLTAGWYKVSFDVLTLSHTAVAGGLHIGLGSSGNNVQSVGRKSYITYYAGGVTEFQIRPNAAGVGTISIDNISVKEVTGIHATQATTANKSILRLTSGKYNWVFDATDLLTATYPAGYESVTVINSLAAGQQTLAAQNIVGSYSMGPSVTLYGRFIFKTITASELATIQTFANRLAGL